MKETNRRESERKGKEVGNEGGKKNEEKRINVRKTKKKEMR